MRSDRGGAAVLRAGLCYGCELCQKVILTNTFTSLKCKVRSRPRAVLAVWRLNVGWKTPKKRTY